MHNLIRVKWPVWSKRSGILFTMFQRKNKPTLQITLGDVTNIRSFKNVCTNNVYNYD